jgi:hypothetical protein
MVRSEVRQCSVPESTPCEQFDEFSIGKSTMAPRAVARLRPYLTVLRDSFDEAFASRVLWILLGVSTLVLLAIAPLGLYEQPATEWQPSSVRDWPALIDRLFQASVSEEPVPGKRVWELADESFRKEVQETARGEGTPQPSRRTVMTVLETLNKLLAEPQLYDADAWQTVLLDDTTLKLLERERASLSPLEVRQLNRGLMQAAFSDELKQGPDTQLRLTYFGRYVGDALPIPPGMKETVVSGILAAVMDFFVGTIAVFVAILVTAPMIPQTFEAGAIDLLLSKPISRPLLFLAKFFGGCIFILLNAAFFVLGLWLIMGLRFDMWKSSLLTCIPVFLFLFFIYYSVSALAGVIWKNATVSIVITILFWALCFTVETSKEVIEQFFVTPVRVTELIATGERGEDDSWLAMSHGGDLLEWNAAATQWQILMPGQQNGPPMMGERMSGAPQYDQQQRRVLYLREPRDRPFRVFRSGPSLIEIRWSDGTWQRNTGPAPPQGAARLLVPRDGRPVVVTDTKIFSLNDEVTTDEGGSEVTKESREAPQIFGFKLPFGGSQGPYEPLGPHPNLRADGPIAAAMSANSDELAVYSQNTLTHLRKNDKGLYQRTGTRDFKELATPVTLALASDSILLVASDGDSQLIDTEDLSTRCKLQPLGNRPAKRAMASPSGNWFAVQAEDGTAVVFDRQGKSVRELGEASAVTMLGENHLLLADRTNRVTSYELGTWAIAARYAPPLDTLQTIHRYLLIPSYTVLPNPGKLGDVVSYLLSDKASDADAEATDLPHTATAANLRQPVISSLLFVIVMLGATCWYVSRVDI